ncbi:hypothetical protein CERSUDRAFT_73126 [Gelatoporia subvermispora B]|uniref:Uncharacterized protein n=1 Tax=Ceriporiopsis subvermispora (strain B) TaxID=914234 RepID=M2R2B5_CERS8|nr:hypothetical protein CERSUDRAFT_73126 [Gelatoporia subvermispora B]
MSSSLPTEVATLISRMRQLLPPLLSTQRASWEQGVAAQALLECHQLFTRSDLSSSASPFDLFQYTYAFAHDTLVRQAEDGRIGTRLNGDGTSDAGAADPACIGESIYYVLQQSRSGREVPAADELEEGVDKMLEYVMEKCSRAPVNDSNEDIGSNWLLSHRIDTVQIWSDTVYMLPPFLVSASLYLLSLEHVHTQYQSRRLLTMGLQQVMLAAKVLQAETGEWSHIYDLSTSQFKRKAFWGVGNGWVCGGILRILRPIAYEARDPLSPLVVLIRSDQELIGQMLQCHDILMDTITACLRHMRTDYLFHDILDDPVSFVETNLSQELAYALYRVLDFHLNETPLPGVAFPRLSQETLEEWEKTAEHLRDAAIAKTDSMGFVRDVCGSPSFDKLGTAAEGQAWGILMEVARAEYLLHKPR